MSLHTRFKPQKRLKIKPTYCCSSEISQTEQLHFRPLSVVDFIKSKSNFYDISYIYINSILLLILKIKKYYTWFRNSTQQCYDNIKHNETVTYEHNLIVWCFYLPFLNEKTFHVSWKYSYEKIFFFFAVISAIEDNHFLLLFCKEHEEFYINAM